MILMPNVKIRITRDVKQNINGMLLAVSVAVTGLVVANLISLINCLALI